MSCASVLLLLAALLSPAPPLPAPAPAPAPSFAPAPAPGEPVVLESEHYRLLAWPPFDEGEEYLRVAEALHAQLKEYFQAEPEWEGRKPKPDGKPDGKPNAKPEEKLEVRFWPDAAGYLAGGKADGIPADALAAGGIYWTGTKRAYFWRQPSASFTRHLFLHEMTHQFHFLAVMDNRARSPGWYTEGLAEYFGTHHWDGSALAPGESDIVGLEEDVPRMAEEGRSGAYDLEAVVSGKRGADKPPSWAAVHFFLRCGDAKVTARFHAAEKKMWRGLAGDPLVDALLGDHRRAMNAAARAHLAGLRTTWKIEWIHWDARGIDPARCQDILGESTVVALVRTRTPVLTGTAFVEATLEETSGSAGLVLGFRSVDDFLAIYRFTSGEIRIVRRAAGKWETLASAVGPAGESARLRAEASPEGRVRILSTGEAPLEPSAPSSPGTGSAPPAAPEPTLLLEFDCGPGVAEGPVGFFVDGGKSRFRDIEIPASPSPTK